MSTPETSEIEIFLLQRHNEHANAWAERVRGRLQQYVDEPIGPMPRQHAWNGERFVDMLTASSAVCAASESLELIPPYCLRDENDVWIEGMRSYDGLIFKPYFSRYATLDAAYEAATQWSETFKRSCSINNVFSNSIQWVGPDEEETQEDFQPPVRRTTENSSPAPTHS